MRALLLLSLSTLRAKYWAVPALMALGAMILAPAVVAFDRVYGPKWIDYLPWLHVNEPEGARSLLSTIAGSMITVAGVTFSITIAALATTAATFGPRLISNFMQNRGNQITLGTFIATFLFCLLVLRTVRTGDSALGSFVPHAAVVVALLFALASLGVLIYFIHHVPESIHISNVVASLGHGLLSQVDEMFPEMLGEPISSGEQPEEDTPFCPSRGPPASLPAGRNGYIQYVDGDGLFGRAKKHDLIVELRHRPGDFIGAQKELAQVWPQGNVNEKILRGLRGTIVIGGYRSQQQDVLFLVNRLVEVAARALSPGMNDIFTATNAMDWLGAALEKLVARKFPVDCRYDEKGNLRVIAHGHAFDDVASAVFDQLRPYAMSDRTAALHLMRVLADVGREAADRKRRAVLLMHVKALRHAALDAVDHPRDIEAIESLYGTTLAALSVPAAEGR